jgi:hypothetical protein
LDAAAPDLDRLEQKIHSLKREYDLFLAGQRRTEPGALREEIDRELRLLSRNPLRSTAVRFRMTSLAHRFRALEDQIRKILDQRAARRRDAEAPLPPVHASVVVDRVALENPKAIEPHLRSLHRELVEILGERPAPPLENLKTRLLEEARRIVARPGVLGVRFTVVEEDNGPRIRGELLDSGTAE